MKDRLKLILLGAAGAWLAGLAVALSFGGSHAFFSAILAAALTAAAAGLSGKTDLTAFTAAIHWLRLAVIVSLLLLVNPRNQAWSVPPTLALGLLAEVLLGRFGKGT